MTTHTEALEVLNSVRRSLADRLADAVVRNRRHLLDGANVEGNPFSQHRGLDEMIVGLGRLDTAIAALRTFTGHGPGNAESQFRHAQGFDRPSLGGGLFCRFTGLVAVGRLEEAARELVNIFRMPHDGMTTATRFFDRAVRADPTIAQQLEDLPASLENASSAQCMSLLVKTFGFQAVETRAAVAAIKAAAHSDTHTISARTSAAV